MTETVTQSDTSFSMKMDKAKNKNKQEQVFSLNSRSNRNQSLLELISTVVPNQFVKKEPLIPNTSTSDLDTTDEVNFPIENEFVLCETWRGSSNVSENYEDVKPPKKSERSQPISTIAPSGILSKAQRSAEFPYL